jgi:hypothetical protein
VEGAREGGLRERGGRRGAELCCDALLISGVLRESRLTRLELLMTSGQASPAGLKSRGLRERGGRRGLPLLVVELEVKLDASEYERRRSVVILAGDEV